MEQKMQTTVQDQAEQSCQIDLTHTTDDREFIQNELQRNNRGRFDKQVVLRWNYDAREQTCHLTGETFSPSVPLAFFYEGDRSKPVCTPEGACGFALELTTLWTICSLLKNEWCLKHLIPLEWRQSFNAEYEWINSRGHSTEAINESFRTTVSPDEAHRLKVQQAWHEAEWLKPPQVPQLKEETAPSVVPGGISIEEALALLKS